MNRRVLPFLASAMLAACSAVSTTPPPPPSPTTPPAPTTPPSQVMLPTLGGNMPQLLSGMVTLSGDSGAGTATFTQAPRYVDGSAAPSLGTGSFSVQLAANTYASTSAQSLFGVFPDDHGTQYVVIGLITDDAATHRAEEVYGVILQSDFAAGADVALDGSSRYAIYVAGDDSADDPDTVAIATTGTIHLGAGATLAGPVDATLSGTFVAADLTGPGAPDGGTLPSDPPAPAAGSYTLTLGQPYAHCNDALAGHESDFAVPPPSLGLQASYAVSVSSAPGQVVVSAGGQLASVFGGDPLPLVASQSAWGVDFTGGAVTGPDATERTDALFFVDASTTPYQSAIGLVYQTGDLAGICTVSWGVTFTP